ncbi:MAG TPA: helix-turn-helix domain-containing protein [Verrucomicrobiae bacterium]|nr:helix-turn-helix domain-containing protein [Verrucomicrobiae bacterium]
MTLASKSVCDEETVNNAGKLEAPSNQILLACILLLPKDAAPLLALLKQVNGNSGPSTTGQIADVRTMNSPRPQSESWLAHLEAADYLGISKSTLYRFACEGSIGRSGTSCRGMIQPSFQIRAKAPSSIGPSRQGSWFGLRLCSLC